jgi:hypothetical protein
MKSVSQMVNQCEGLIDTTDVTDWENEFLTSVLEQHKAGKTLSPKQAEIVERIYGKHFA